MGADNGGGPRAIISRSPSLCDSRWHKIDVFQTSPRSFSMQVDNQYPETLTLVMSRNTLDLTGELFIGGVPASLRSRLPSNVMSRSMGFSGCMSSMVVNEKLIDTMTDARILSPSVTPGCTS